MGTKNTRKYTDDFKRRAVEMAADIGMSPTETKLGIPHGNIRNWKMKMQSEGRVSKTDQKAMTMEMLSEENHKLREELSQSKKANTILKAAAAFFSQDHLK